MTAIDRRPAPRCRPAVFGDLSDAEEAAYRTAAVRELQEEANVTITVDDLVPLRALGDARDRNPPLRHALLPGAHAGRTDAEARRERDHRARVAVADVKRSRDSSGASCCCRRRRGPRFASSRIARRSTTRWRGRRSKPIVRVMPGFFKDGDLVDVDAAGRSVVSDDSGLGCSGRNAFCAARRSSMAAAEGLIAAIDRVIEYFNARQTRSARWLLRSQDAVRDQRRAVRDAARTAAERSAGPDAGARGPAGFRFTSKALQHAMPDAKLGARRDGHRWRSVHDRDRAVVVGQIARHERSRQHGRPDHAEASRAPATSKSPRPRSTRTCSTRFDRRALRP